MRAQVLDVRILLGKFHLQGSVTFLKLTFCVARRFVSQKFNYLLRLSQLNLGKFHACSFVCQLLLKSREFKIVNQLRLFASLISLRSLICKSLNHFNSPSSGILFVKRRSVLIVFVKTSSEGMSASLLWTFCYLLCL
jgi:hypothetical protein